MIYIHFMEIVRTWILHSREWLYDTVRDFLTQLALPVCLFEKQGLICCLERISLNVFNCKHYRYLSIEKTAYRVIVDYINKTWSFCSNWKWLKSFQAINNVSREQKFNISETSGMYSWWWKQSKSLKCLISAPNWCSWSPKKISSPYPSFIFCIILASKSEKFMPPPCCYRALVQVGLRCNTVIFW
jgi:hypothetical protein